MVKALIRRFKESYERSNREMRERNEALLGLASDVRRFLASRASRRPFGTLEQELLGSLDEAPKSCIWGGAILQSWTRDRDWYRLRLVADSTYAPRRAKVSGGVDCDRIALPTIFFFDAEPDEGDVRRAFLEAEAPAPPEVACYGDRFMVLSRSRGLSTRNYWRLGSIPTGAGEAHLYATGRAASHEAPSAKLRELI